MSTSFVRGSKPREISYITYIDEAGDPGLEKVKPLDPDGSSEWFIVSAVVVRAERASEVQGWVQHILTDIRSRARSLHFAKLSPRKKARVCELVSSLPVRGFVTISNKKNMKGHRNPFAENRSDKAIPKNQWFSNWLSRILFEKVTHFIYHDSMSRHKEPRLSRVEISARGGLIQDYLDDYFSLLRMQTSSGKLFLPGDIEWPVLEREFFEVKKNHQSPGLQIADVVASAFYKACDCIDTGPCDPQFAIALQDRMARLPNSWSGRPWGYGVKLMPALRTADLAREQSKVFGHYLRLGGD